MKISIDFTKLMRAGLLLVFTVFLFRLAMSGEINYLVSPIIAFIVKISIVLLTVSTLALLKWSFAAPHHQDHHQGQHDHHDACDCGHDHALSSSRWGKATILLFSASLVVAFSWHPKTLGTEMIAKAAVNESSLNQSAAQTTSIQSIPDPAPTDSSGKGSTASSSGSLAAAPGSASAAGVPSSSAGGSPSSAAGSSSAAAGSVSSVTPADSASAANGSTSAAAGAASASALTNPDAANASAGVVDQQEGTESQASIAMRFEEDPSKYYGKKVTMDGFVYHPPGMPSNYFILTRFFVFCCIADASPTGIAVETADATNLKSDSWVTVTGTIQPRKLPILNQIQPTNWCPDVADKPVIIPGTIKKIPSPSQPYMFPR